MHPVAVANGLFGYYSDAMLRFRSGGCGNVEARWRDPFRTQRASEARLILKR